MTSRQPDLFDERSNWVMNALLLTVLIGTSLTSRFEPWPLHGPVLVGGLLCIFVTGWFEPDLRQRFPRAWPFIFHPLQWLFFVAICASRVPSNFTWLLAMPMVSHAVGRLPGWGAALVAAAYFGVSTWAFYGPNLTVKHATGGMLSLAVAYLFTAVITLAMVRSIKAQHQSESLAEELERANAQLRATAEQQAALAAAEERNRIARDIHDGLGHYLTVITVQLQAAQAGLQRDPDRAAEGIRSAEQLAQRALEEVRRSVGALRTAGATLPLPESLAGLVRESGNPAVLCVEGPVRRLPPEVEQTLFRTAQEGLTNVRKHARASRIELCLDYRNTQAVSLEVRNDGCVASSSSQPPGYGLMGLRERITGLGGSLSAEAGRAGEFQLRVSVPA